MKRKEMINKIRDLLLDPNYTSAIARAHDILLMVEEQGMLPPINTCKLVPDDMRPGMLKHSETKREWDKEEMS